LIIEIFITLTTFPPSFVIEVATPVPFQQVQSGKLRTTPAVFVLTSDVPLRTRALATDR